MSVAPQHFRIFISSPGDVAEERSIALRVIEQLPNHPMFRDRVTLRAVAWDKLGAGTPMLANMTPQEAINQGMPKPSECDIVVVVFWMRMGTPLPEEYKKPDGSQYLSGTEWEFEDAFKVAKATGKPFTVVYRRTEEVLLDDKAPDYEQRLEQKRRVEVFFDTFKNPDGSIRQASNKYEKADDFRQQFETHLEELVMRLLQPPLLSYRVKKVIEATKSLTASKPNTSMLRDKYRNSLGVIIDDLHQSFKDGFRENGPWPALVDNGEECKQKEYTRDKDRWGKFNLYIRPVIQDINANSAIEPLQLATDFNYPSMLTQLCNRLEDVVGELDAAFENRLVCTVENRIFVRDEKILEVESLRRAYHDLYAAWRKWYDGINADIEPSLNSTRVDDG